ncbi:hypothetical protein GCM10023197_45420 [Gordonia humi]
MMDYITGNNRIFDFLISDYAAGISITIVAREIATRHFQPDLVTTKKNI